MIDILKSLFSDAGTISMMRMLCLIVTLVACGIAIKGGDTTLILGMLGLSLGAKIGQKALE